MKITKTPNDIYAKNEARRQANIGCLSCPTCGNRKIVELIDYIKDPQQDTIVKMVFGCTKQSLFKYESGSIDKYTCKVCGTEWESEIY